LPARISEAWFTGFQAIKKKAKLYYLTLEIINSPMDETARNTSCYSNAIYP